MINLALMCGSDYTTGIQGLGPVSALEVLAEFKGDGLQPLIRFKLVLFKPLLLNVRGGV